MLAIQLHTQFQEAGIIQLTKWLSTALAPKIRVNSISPGGIKKISQKNSF